MGCDKKRPGNILPRNFKIHIFRIIFLRRQATPGGFNIRIPYLIETMALAVIISRERSI